MLWLFDKPTAIALISIIKGWLFVIVTSLLLYGFMRRRVGLQESAEKPVKSKDLRLPLALLTITVLLLAFAAIQLSFVNNKETAFEEMQAVADFKTQLITEWVDRKQKNADFMRTSGFFSSDDHRWHESGYKESLLARLEHWCRHIGCAEVKLLNPQGRKLSGGHDGSVTEPQRQAVQLAITEWQIRHAGPYLDTNGRMHIDFVVPLTAIPGSAPVVVLHFDPGESIFPALQTWPMPSVSAEVLLFRFTGDQVHYLNKLTGQDSSEALLYLPKTTENLLAAQIQNPPKAQRIRVEGVDYRGIPVIGIVNTIPDTDWFLLVKLNQAELYTKVFEDAVWIGISGIMALFTTGVGFFLLRQRQQLVQVQAAQQAQAERLKALSLLSAIADSSSDAIFAKDLKGRYTLFNHATERITGKTSEDMLGLDDTVIFSAEQAEMLNANDKTVLAEGRTITYREVLDVPAGKRIFLATKGPLFGSDGNPVGLFGISRDITDLNQAEQALRESEGRFRALVEQSLAGIYIIQNNRFAYVNPALAAMFGYDSRASLVDSVPVTDLVSPDNRAEVVHNINRLIKGEVDNIMHYTFTALRRDGCRIIVEAHGSTFDYQGRPAVIGMIIDISARKAAEDSLRKSEQRFQDIVNASADWIWEVDAESRYTYASESVQKMLGYTPEEILGKTPFDFMPPAEGCRVQKQFTDIKVRHEPFRNLDNINLHKDGSLRYMQTNGMPILDSKGRLLGYRGLDQDVTERKQAELALRRSEAFNRAILDSVNAQIAVLDGQGFIVAVNQPWQRFAEENRLNSSLPDKHTEVDVNYLSVCFHSPFATAKNAQEARNGINAVLEGRLSAFSLEYPCHVQGRQRWFIMTVTPMDPERQGVVVAHTDISDRKAVEEALRRQTEELEQHNAELERFNSAAIGRELDMIALKRQVNELSNRLGKKPPFNLTFLDLSEQHPFASGDGHGKPK